ncbi:MAG: class I SAM-dependent methyltransferase [Actinomycetota bacterium]|nr:class I SAM-dependent methyltransferase [Actinomycetota bacterium]
MTATAADSVVATLPDVVGAALRNLVRDPAIRWSVDRVQAERHVAAETGCEYTLLHVTVSTNSARHLLGLFAPLPSAAYAGFHTSYLYGYVHAHFQASLGLDVWRAYTLAFDVAETGDGQPPPLYRCVPTSEALRRGLIAEHSPLERSLREYQIERVFLAGDLVSGPSAGMMRTVAELTRRERPVRVLDAFAGTCALGRVAAQSGAERVVCVDRELDEAAARDTLGPWAPVCELVSQDLGDFLAERDDATYDLVILDPFYETALESVSCALERLGGRWRTLAVNLGPPYYAAWVAQLAAVLREHAVSVETRVVEEETVAVCERNPL